MFSFADLWVRYMQNHCFADLSDCQFYARRSMRLFKMICSDWGWINGVFLNRAKIFIGCILEGIKLLLTTEHWTCFRKNSCHN